MRRPLRAFVATAALSAGLVVAASAPATATITATRTKGVLTVVITGNHHVSFSCQGGTVRVNGQDSSPPTPCGLLTKVVATGDGVTQSVDLRALDGRAFAAQPTGEVALGGGLDVVWDTDGPDVIDLGAGADILYLNSGSSANLSNHMGAAADGNHLEVLGTPQADEITVSATTARQVTVRHGDATVHTVPGVNTLAVRGDEGDDTINADGVPRGLWSEPLTLDGGTGRNQLTSRTHATGFSSFGGSASMIAGGSEDWFRSTSHLDAITDLGGISDVTDMTGPQSGGRSLQVPGSLRYRNLLDVDSVAAAVRPQVDGGYVVTSGLDRPGLQQLPATTARIQLSAAERHDMARSLTDVVVGRAALVVDPAFGGMVDVTIPTGSWTITQENQTQYEITTSDPNLGDVSLAFVGAIQVHGPWADHTEGFVHRIHRDLGFTFLPDEQRRQIRDAIAAGTSSRVHVGLGIIDSDGFLANEIQGVFHSYLGRAATDAENAQWIARLRSGSSLTNLRAAVMASDEFFARAGGTNQRFVQRAADLALGGDQSGRSGWLQMLEAGMPRADVASGILTSTDARAYLVRNIFLRLLHRQPTAAETTTWTSALTGGSKGEQYTMLLLAVQSEYLHLS